MGVLREHCGMLLAAGAFIAFPTFAYAQTDDAAAPAEANNEGQPEAAAPAEAPATDEAATEAPTDPAAEPAAPTDAAAPAPGEPAVEPAEPVAEPAAVEPAPVETAPEPISPEVDSAPVEEAPPIAIAKADKVEEIMVTGSRIRRKTLTTEAPVTVLSREQMGQTGKMSIGAILQQLPSQGNAINVQFNNGGSGATRMNLRSIGSSRTLVLVNGRRHVAGGTGANTSVDLNAIPVGVIERVEILKDGASAVYGTDAIGGVVNIITRQDFEGVEANAYIGSTSRNDAQTYDVSFTTGAASDKGSFMISGGFYEQKSSFAGSRVFGNTDREYDYDPDTPEDERVYDQGSSAPPEGSLIDRIGDPGNFNFQRRGTTASGSPCGFCFMDPNGLRNFGRGGVANYDLANPYEVGDFYNYQPQNYLVTPQRRYNVWAQGQYHLTDTVKAYVEASYINRKSAQILAPTPLFIISEGISVSKDNVYNPYGRDFIDIRRRMVEAKNRRFRQDIDTFRIVTGLTGELPDMGSLTDWTWDMNLNFGRTNATSINEGRFRRSSVIKALGPDEDCVDDCVPLNLFGGAGTITKEQLDYISYTGIARGYSQQQSANLGVSGNLFEIVEGNPVALALGYEFRSEKGGNLPDPITASGDTTGNKEDPTKGEFYLNEAYGELVIPILADMPGIKALEVTAAVRAFDYSTFGAGATYKLGAKWDVTEFFAFRGTYSTGYRAPGVGALFAGTSDSFPSVSDPCSGDRTDRVDANCKAEGIVADTKDPNTQLRARVGGNKDLQPETATTFTVGAVLSPTMIKGLEATVDYWNITIDDSITTLGAQVILEACYNAPSPDQRQFCEFVQRDPNLNNNIINIIDTLTNTGGTKTSGVDLSLRYSKGTGFGRLGLDTSATYLVNYDEIIPSTLNPGGEYRWKAKGVYDFNLRPALKWNTTVSWNLDGAQAGFVVRYISGGKECEDVCNGEAPPEAETPPSRPISAIATVDLFTGYTMDVLNGKSTISAGINNLLDQDPPVIYNGFQADSDGATYDYLGRYFYLRLTHQF